MIPDVPINGDVLACATGEAGQIEGWCEWVAAAALVWDQYDNAQRIDDKGFGVRLDTYNFHGEELATAIDDPLADQEMRRTLAEEAAQIQRESDVEEGSRSRTGRNRRLWVLVATESLPRSRSPSACR